MDARDYVKKLKAASEPLRRMRDLEIRQGPPPRVAILELSGAFRHALLSRSFSDSSGLVEYQRVISRLRR